MIAGKSKLLFFSEAGREVRGVLTGAKPLALVMFACAPHCSSTSITLSWLLWHARCKAVLPSLQPCIRDHQCAVCMRG